MKKTIRLDNSLSTKVKGVDIHDDRILVVGFNFKGDSSYNYVAILDTNFNLLNYENLHKEFGNISTGIRTNYSFTSDGGALIAFSPPTFTASLQISLK